MVASTSAPRVSIIIPVANEAATIETIVEHVRRAPLPGEREIIVVDDGSSDGTPQKVEKLATQDPELIRVVAHDVNRGKGAAIRTGIAHVRGEIVLVQDADLG